MKDFLGNELYVGDGVIFIYGGGSGHRLMKGEIEEIRGGLAYIKGMRYGCYAGDDPEREERGRRVKVKSASVYRIDGNPFMVYARKSVGLELNPVTGGPVGEIRYLD